jgi:polyisoprenyl-teichoic acid--peptidoglycan teichoic acid transferase
MKLDRSPNNKRGRRTATTTFMIVAAIALALIVLPVVGILAASVLHSVTERLDEVVNGGSKSSESFTPKLTLSQVGAWQGTERLNILLMGIDQRPNDDPDKTRTDTMIILTLDPASKSAGMMSIPRDLYVPLPNRGQDRINTAHVYGGPTYAMQSVEYNFGIPMQHYVRVNFNALTTLVDLVGGIDLYVDEDINDQSYPDMNYGYDPFIISAGWHHMDGATALKYARTRHGSSDFYRMRRQQQVIMALRDRVLSTDAVTKLLPNAPQILLTLRDSISTDFSPSEIVQLALFAKDLPPERISKVLVDEKSVQPWTTPTGGSVLIPIRDRIHLLREELYNPPAPVQISSNATPEAGRIAVHNGTNTKGLAATAQASLQAKGFTVTELGNASGDHPKTIIVDYHGRQQYIAQLANALGVPISAVNTTLDSNSQLDALVILGDDYQPK